jgi:hypothetical protein
MLQEPQDLVTVYTVGNPIEAEIIKNALLDEDIACSLENENQAGEAGLMGLEIKIQVPSSQAKQAREFLLEHERERANRPPSKDDDDDAPPDEHIQQLQ